MNKEDPLDYACPPFFPWEDGYNSNSYLHGLLNAAGMPPPVFPTYDIPFRLDPSYPGWDHPVPIVEFGPLP